MNGECRTKKKTEPRRKDKLWMFVKTWCRWIKSKLSRKSKWTVINDANRLNCLKSRYEKQMKTEIAIMMRVWIRIRLRLRLRLRLHIRIRIRLRIRSRIRIEIKRQIEWIIPKLQLWVKLDLWNNFHEFWDGLRIHRKLIKKWFWFHSIIVRMI
jgi:hypothetical protein